MKITKSKLIQIIQEETQKAVSESWADMLAATGDMEKMKRAETQADMIEKIPDLMRADSQDPQAFIQWVQEYDPSDWTQEDTEQTIEFLRNAPRLGKEVQKYVKNVDLYTQTGGEKGHQFTPEPWNARYMKTLDSWIEQDASDLRNHLAAIMAEYIQDELLGGFENIGIDRYDAGFAPYGDED